MKKFMAGLLALILSIATVVSAMPEQARAADTHRFLMLQVRLKTDDGIKEYGDGLDLSGLTFRLWGQRAGSDQWEAAATTLDKPDDPGAVESVDYYYVGYFKADFGRISHPDYYVAYKVTLDENSSYEMKETPVEPGHPGDTGQSIAPSTEYYLDVTKKEVPADSTSVSVSGVSSAWTGSGTAEMPYEASGTVARSIDEISIRTANEEAVITYGGTAYTGKLTAALNYGENVFEFSVTSKDESTVGYYRAVVTREKQTTYAPSADDIKGMSPSVEGGSDGRIIGLDSRYQYEYKTKEAEKYTPVAQGSTEITGLSAGVYQVRYSETESSYASPDRIITISEPVFRSFTLPKEEIPEGVSVLECPKTVTAGWPYTIRLQLPDNTLLGSIKYTNQTTGADGVSFGTISHTQENGHTIAVIQFDANMYDCTISDITLLEGRYYTITTGPEADEWEAPFMQCEVKVTNESTQSGDEHYYKAGTEITAEAEISSEWQGFAELTSLTVYKNGTKETVEPVSLVKESEKKWILTFVIDEDVDIRYGVYAYPCDTAEMDAVIAQIGDMSQYVDNSAKETMITRLSQQESFRKQPLKNQSMVDNYTELLQSAYNELTLRQDLTDNADVEIALDGSPHTYDGKEWKPEITVSYQGSRLEEGTDYTVHFPDDMISVGEKEIRIEFIGLYSGEAWVTGSIVEKAGVVNPGDDDKGGGSADDKTGDDKEDGKSADGKTGAVQTGIQLDYLGYAGICMLSLIISGTIIVLKKRRN